MRPPSTRSVNAALTGRCYMLDKERCTLSVESASDRIGSIGNDPMKTHVEWKVLCGVRCFHPIWLGG
ncbi:MAG: hypothetical protein RL518_1846 [Pseudomonadota bacterium]